MHKQQYATKKYKVKNALTAQLKKNVHSSSHDNKRPHQGCVSKNLFCAAFTLFSLPFLITSSYLPYYAWHIRHNTLNRIVVISTNITLSNVNGMSVVSVF